MAKRAESNPLLNHPVLPEEECVRLIRAAQAGNRACRDLIILHNQRLVHAIARTFLFRRHSLEDLVGWGNIGLIKAVDRIDLTTYSRFDHYFARAIANEIRGHLFEHPHYLDKYVRRYFALQKSTRLEHDEIIARTGIKGRWKPSLEQALMIMGASGFGLRDDDGWYDPVTTLDQQDEWHHFEAMARLHRPRQFSYLKMYYIDEMSHREIAEQSNFSRGYILQSIKNALEEIPRTSWMQRMS